MFLLYLNSPQNIVVFTCKVNREWSDCLQHSKSFERLARTKNIWFSFDLHEFRSRSIETRWVEILQNFREWGSLRPKYFIVIQWNHENSDSSSWLPMESLGKWQKHYCPDCVVVPPLKTWHRSKEVEFIHLSPRAQRHPILFLSHKDLCKGYGDLHSWSYCLWKSEVLYRMLCLCWNWRKVKNPGAIEIYYDLQTWIFTEQNSFHHYWSCISPLQGLIYSQKSSSLAVWFDGCY